MDSEAKSEPAGELRFRYDGVAVQNMFGILWIALGVFFCISSYYIKITGRERQHGDWFGVLLIGLFVIWSGVLILRSYFKTSREIAVDDHGITAFAFGRTWRFIRWAEVARIVRIRRPMVTEWNTWRDGYEFMILGCQNEEIWFVDNIVGLTGLLGRLNRYVERNNIPLVAFDRGSDTRPKIRATASDRAERKRLLREGYKTTLSSLMTQ